MTLEDTAFSIGYLVARAKEKEAIFESNDGVFYFASNLLRVRDLITMPRMTRPLDLELLKARFVPIAEDLLRGLSPSWSRGAHGD